MEPEEFEQIKRAHQHARPNPVANPAWANSHRDLGKLIAAYEDQCETIHNLLRAISVRNDALEKWENRGH
jgi:hypothetical protein